MSSRHLLHLIRDSQALWMVAALMVAATCLWLARRPGRAALRPLLVWFVATLLFWLTTDNDIEGWLVVRVSRHHGVTTMDAVPLLLLVVAFWRRSRNARFGGEPAS